MASREPDAARAMLCIDVAVPASDLSGLDSSVLLEVPNAEPEMTKPLWISMFASSSDNEPCTLVFL